MLKTLFSKKKLFLEKNTIICDWNVFLCVADLILESFFFPSNTANFWIHRRCITAVTSGSWSADQTKPKSTSTGDWNTTANPLRTCASAVGSSWPLSPKKLSCTSRSRWARTKSSLMPCLAWPSVKSSSTSSHRLLNVSTEFWSSIRIWRA